MDGRQKPNEKEKNKQNEMAEFQTPSNSFLPRFTSDKMTKIKLKRLKKLTFSFFPGNLHKKNLQIFVFF
jgi:hypothetical protein